MLSGILVKYKKELCMKRYMKLWCEKLTKMHKIIRKK